MADQSGTNQTGTNQTEIGTKDGTGCSDRDKPYVFGSPGGELTLRQQAKLMILRGYVIDAKAGLAQGAGDLTLDYAEPVQRS